MSKSLKKKKKIGELNDHLKCVLKVLKKEFPLLWAHLFS